MFIFQRRAFFESAIGITRGNLSAVSLRALESLGTQRELATAKFVTEQRFGMDYVHETLPLLVGILFGGNLKTGMGCLLYSMLISTRKFRIIYNV